MSPMWNNRLGFTNTIEFSDS